MKSESEMQVLICSSATEKLDFVTWFTLHLLWLGAGFDWTTVFEILEQINRLCNIERPIYLRYSPVFTVLVNSDLR